MRPGSRFPKFGALAVVAVAAAMLVPVAGLAAPAPGAPTKAPSWDDLAADFSAIHDRFEVECATRLRTVIEPPTGASPKPLRIELKLTYGTVDSLAVAASSGAPEADDAALEAVRHAAAAASAGCKPLDRITIVVPFR